jgi:O-antigen/teichoic acid export membrane protein
MGYTKQAIAGFSWDTFFKLSSGGLIVIKMAILARLLTPEDFGLFSLTTIALGVMEASTQTGVNITIIQSDNSVGYFLDTAWVIAIIRGFLIGSFMLILGMGMAQWYQQPELMTTIIVAALIPVIKGFINPAIIGLRKELNFFKDSMYNISLQVVEAVLAVILAFATHSVFSLIIAMIGAAFFEVFISFIFFSHRPRFAYSASRAKNIFQNSVSLGFSALFNYLHENLDNVIVGSVVPLAGLGIYHKSYGLAHKPNYDLSRSAVHSTLPIFAKITHQPQRLWRAFAKSGGVTLVVVCLASLPILLFPKQIVLILLGEQWTEAIAILPLLTLAGIIQALNTVVYNLFIVKKWYATMNTHLFLTVLCMVLGVWWGGTHYGLLGAVYGVLISRIITTPLLGWNVWRIFKNSSPTV